MERTGQYTLHEGPNLSRCRRLQRAGKPLSVWVNGDAIDLQITLGRLTLLATSYDYFDGCQHWLYLLGEDGRPIDQIHMPDQVGYIERVERLSDHVLSFGYMGTENRWRLIVDEGGFRSFSLKELVARPNRFLLRKRHLMLRRSAGASDARYSGDGVEPDA